MMVAARVAFGRKNSSGVRNIVASAMPTAVKAPAAGVSAPASKFTTERAKPPVTGNPPETAAPMFAGAERDQFLVGVDALAALGGERQGDRDRLHVAHDGDQQRGDEELRPERRSNGGRVSLGRPCGTVPTMRTPRSASPKPQTAAVVATMATAGPTFARMSAVRSPSPRPQQQRLEAAAHPEEKGERSEADHRGVGIDVAEVGHQRLQDLHEVLALGVDAEHGRELARRDLDGPRR